MNTTDLQRRAWMPQYSALPITNANGAASQNRCSAPGVLGLPVSSC